jgi:hypothetical protein
MTPCRHKGCGVMLARTPEGGWGHTAPKPSATHPHYPKP